MSTGQAVLAASSLYRERPCLSTWSSIIYMPPVPFCTREGRVVDREGVLVKPVVQVDTGVVFQYEGSMYFYPSRANWLSGRYDHVVRVPELLLPASKYSRFRDDTVLMRCSAHLVHPRYTISF